MLLLTGDWVPGCRREGETVLLIPALTIDSATAEEGLDILEACA